MAHKCETRKGCQPDRVQINSNIITLLGILTDPATICNLLWLVWGLS